MSCLCESVSGSQKLLYFNIAEDATVYLNLRLGGLLHVEEEYHLPNLFGRLVDVWHHS